MSSAGLPVICSVAVLPVSLTVAGDGLQDQGGAIGEGACWHIDKIEPELAVWLLVELVEDERVLEADLPGGGRLDEALVADEEGRRLVRALREHLADLSREQARRGEAEVAAQGQGACRRTVEEDSGVPGYRRHGVLALP